MSDLLLRLRAMPSSLNDGCRTMDEAAARIEALEAALRALDEPDIDAEIIRHYRIAYERIEALEAALRFILVDPPAALDAPDTDAEIIRHYREVARNALSPKEEP